MEVVRPKYAEGWNMSLAQLWGSGPKFTIVCGKCGEEFSQRIEVKNNPRVVCPYCRTINEIPVCAGY